jgi:hypothetical protein
VAGALGGKGPWALGDVISNLPADLPCNPALERYTVPPEDLRTGLHGACGVRVKPGSPALRTGTFLGVYRGRGQFSKEYEQWIIDTTPEGQNPAVQEWVCESYANNLEHFT